MAFKKRVQNIQTAGYNGVHTVVFILFKIISELEKMKIKQDDVNFEKAPQYQTARTDQEITPETLSNLPSKDSEKCWLPWTSWPCTSSDLGKN